MRSHRGFTIIEILIAVAVVAILVAVGAPSLRDLVVGVRVRTVASDLYESLLFARSEAIKRNAIISVVPNSGGWVAGWQVRVDADNTVLKVADAAPTVTATANATGNISFAMTGRVTTGVRSVVFSADSTPTVKARCVMLDASGRPTVRIDNDTNAANGCI